MQSTIKTNKQSKRPERLLFLDTETKSVEVDDHEELTMDIAWTYFCRQRTTLHNGNGKWQYHTDRWELCRYIDSLVPEKTNVTILAHNVFFDLQALGFFWYFTSEGWRLDFFYDAGLTYILVIRKGNRTIKALSTTNWFATSLANLGETIGYPKLEVDLEHDDAETIKEYCKRDVEIMIKAMSAYFKFLDLHDLGNFGMTKSAQSFNAYRHRFYHVPIAIHREEQIVTLERAAYMGGRTEAFQLGMVSDGPFVSLDVNAMYPSIMRSQKLPRQLIEHVENPLAIDVECVNRQFCAVARVEVETDRPAYAVRMNNKICFPVGRFDTYLCSPGLDYAFEHDHIRHVYEAAYYESDYLFTDFVDFFYALKQEYRTSGNEPYVMMVKFMMNSLYGKFGQKRPIENWVNVDAKDGYLRHEIINPVTGKSTTETIFFNTSITQEGEANGKKSLVALPAHITEHGRFALWKMIERLGPERVLYCDTDSVKVKLTDIEPARDLIHESELGKWKIEDTFHKLLIYGAKDYETDTERKLKGVPKSAVEISPGTYQYKIFPSQATHLRMGESEAFILQTVVKHNARNYDKGVVTASGRVEPFRLPSPLLSPDSPDIGARTL